MMPTTDSDPYMLPPLKWAGDTINNWCNTRDDTKDYVYSKFGSILFQGLGGVSDWRSVTLMKQDSRSDPYVMYMSPCFTAGDTKKITQCTYNIIWPSCLKWNLNPLSVMSVLSRISFPLYSSKKSPF